MLVWVLQKAHLVLKNVLKKVLLDDYLKTLLKENIFTKSNSNKNIIKNNHDFYKKITSQYYKNAFNFFKITLNWILHFIWKWFKKGFKCFYYYGN